LTTFGLFGLNTDFLNNPIEITTNISLHHRKKILAAIHEEPLGVSILILVFITRWRSCGMALIYPEFEGTQNNKKNNKHLNG